MSQPSTIPDLLPSSPNYDFSGVPAQALDAVRMRLSQLTHSLSKLRDDMSKAELPQWHSLQAQLTVILTQLSSFTSTLQHFEESLDSTIPYPLPNFPTTAHETMLTTLMRKKQIPEVEAWIKDAIDSSGIDLNTDNIQDIERQIQNDKEETKWALDFVNNERDNYSFQGLYTANKLQKGIFDPKKVLYRSSTSNAMPKSPFSVDSILTYIYQGPKSGQSIKI